MTTARQTEIILPRTTVHAPLISLAAYAQIRGLSPAEVLGAIEQGREYIGTEHIPWAWDISSAVANRRREIRILSCLLTEANRQRELTEEQVWTLIFPPKKHAGLHAAIKPQFVLGTELQRAWSCDNDHVLRLCADASLRTLPNTIIRPGPHGSPVVQWESIKAFLRSRKI